LPAIDETAERILRNWGWTKGICSILIRFKFSWMIIRSCFFDLFLKKKKEERIASDRVLKVSYFQFP
jgi:hypothetical protein